MNISHRGVRITVFVVGGLLAASFLVFVWLVNVASTSWTKSANAVVDEARKRDLRRPVLRGDAVRGRAWPEYESGLAAVNGVVVDDVRRWLDGPPADRAAAVAILVANEKALRFVRSGARRAEGGYPIEWDKGFGADTPSLVAVRNLTTLAVGQARVLLEAGKPREAAELLIDAAQFGADVGRNGNVLIELVGLSSLGLVFDGLRTLPQDPDVGRALAVLDGTFPNHGEAMLNELALVGVGFMRAGPGLAPEWRFGFSQQLVVADAWPTFEDMMRRAAAVTTEPWADARRVEAEIEAEAGKSDNRMIRLMIPGLLRSQRASREARAQLRLLRVLHGGAVGLDDPFGAKIHSDGARVWSIGGDGVDDGGAGAWKPAPTGDIVLELRTK